MTKLTNALVGLAFIATVACEDTSYDVIKQDEEAIHCRFQQPRGIGAGYMRADGDSWLVAKHFKGSWTEKTYKGVSEEDGDQALDACFKELPNYLAE